MELNAHITKKIKRIGRELEPLNFTHIISVRAIQLNCRHPQILTGRERGDTASEEHYVADL
jgi:hypothetical protein